MTGKNLTLIYEHKTYCLGKIKTSEEDPGFLSRDRKLQLIFTCFVNKSSGDVFSRSYVIDLLNVATWRDVIQHDLLRALDCALQNMSELRNEYLDVDHIANTTYIRVFHVVCLVKTAGS